MHNMDSRSPHVRPLLLVSLWAAFLLILTASVGISRAEDVKRVALVIGNGAYLHVPPLPNPSHDAKDIAQSLAAMGFEVDLAVDAGMAELRGSVQRFATLAANAEVALIFYAGHGIQIDGRNFIVPIDAAIASEADVEFETLDLELLILATNEGASVRVILLDACRNNPFEGALTDSMGPGRSAVALSAGLAPLQPSGGVLIGFATDPGAVALDGEGRNSPFAAALLENLPTPGLEINIALTRVRAAVFAGTDGRQRPWTTSSLLHELYLAPEGDPAAEADLAAWQRAAAEGTEAAIEAYLNDFPAGLYRELAAALLMQMRGAAEHASGAGLPVPAPDERLPDLRSPDTRPSLPVPSGALVSVGALRDCVDCPILLAIPPGQFVMGVAFGPEAEKPAVAKTLPKMFGVGQTEVTRREWNHCAQEGACRKLPGPADQVPAAGLSWSDAKAYVAWLTRRTGRTYRLPTETEWEYVAKAGLDLRYPSGQVLLPKEAFYGRKDAAPVTVASYAPNSLGLYDLAGNVWEWVEDCGARYDARLAGPAPVSASPCLRVLRGGGFESSPDMLRSSNRFFVKDQARYDFGLRVAADLTPEDLAQ
jgi:formylglycine-generating enzyme required for sulfatase activity